jgi:Holliday junction resolvase RusA-like endonuclease
MVARISLAQARNLGLLGGRLATKRDELEALGAPAVRKTRRSSPPPVATGILLEPVEFIVPIRAFGKQSVRHRAGEKSFIPDKTRDKMKVIAQEARLAMGWKRPHGGAFLAWITAELVPPETWPKWAREKAIANEFACVLKPDVDNVCKTVLDAVKDIVVADDKFATDATLSKRWGPRDRLVLRFVPSLLPVYRP